MARLKRTHDDTRIPHCVYLNSKNWDELKIIAVRKQSNASEIIDDLIKEYVKNYQFEIK